MRTTVTLDADRRRKGAGARARARRLVQGGAEHAFCAAGLARTTRRPSPTGCPRGGWSCGRESTSTRPFASPETSRTRRQFEARAPQVKLADVNLFLYAVDEASSHSTSRRANWLEETLSGSETFAFSWSVLLELLRLATNRRRLPEGPSLSTQALSTSSTSGSLRRASTCDPSHGTPPRAACESFSVHSARRATSRRTPISRRSRSSMEQSFTQRMRISAGSHGFAGSTRSAAAQRIRAGSLLGVGATGGTLTARRPPQAADRAPSSI